MRNPEGPELDALVDAVAKRLQVRLGGDVPIPIPIPKGDPDLERPQLPWDPINEGPLELFPRRRLRIAGVELTQSIQHHGAAGESFGADNSVPLVALKPLLVRVYPYVSSGHASPDALSGARVTGELVISIGQQVVYRTGPTRAEGVRVGPQGELSRVLWDQELTITVPGASGLGLALRRFNPSLNFQVPAYYCRAGRMHVAVRLWRLGADGSAATQDSAASAQYADFLDVRPPRLALVRVNWVDGAGTVTRPTDQQLLRTTKLAERMLPFPYFDTTILGVEVTSSAAFAMVATGGGCNQAWRDLNTELAVTRIFTSLFQLGDIVIGMVPRAAIPAGAATINSGCAIETGGCFIDENETFAHELGHLYGRAHTAVPGDARSDASYPNYGGDRWSIGEVGVDTGSSPPVLFDPVSADDIMSYRSELWISPYTYRGILDARDLHQSAAADPRRVRPLLFLHVRVHRTERGLTGVELKRSFRLDAPGTVRRNLEAATSPLSIDLVDANRRIVATHHCFYIPPRGCRGCACAGHGPVPLEREPYIDLIEVIEWPGDLVSSLTFHRGEEPFAVLDVGSPPGVEIEGPEWRDDRLVVRVHTDYTMSPSIAVLFSPDDGESWQPVGFDPPEGELSVEADKLPGGERCRFRAIAGANLQSAYADTEPFELARSPRRLHLVTPDDECGIPAGRVALATLLDNRGRGAISPHEIRWRSSLQGELGSGYSITAELSAGEHEIFVSAPDGIGGTLEERGIIIVGGKPQRRGL